MYILLLEKYNTIHLVFLTQNAILKLLSLVIFIFSRFLPDDGKMKISIVVGAIVVVLLLIFMILRILWWKGCLGVRISQENGNLCKSYVDIRNDSIHYL